MAIKLTVADFPTLAKEHKMAGKDKDAPIGYVSDPSDPDDSIKEAAYNAAIVEEQMKQQEALNPPSAE